MASSAKPSPRLMAMPAERRRPTISWQHEVELLWFSDCPNHEAAFRMLEDVIRDLAPGTPIHRVEATDPTVAAFLRFPGSPTIRIDGRDVDPSFKEPDDFTPRCRVYRTSAGLTGVPERAWIETALLGWRLRSTDRPCRNFAPLRRASRREVWEFPPRASSRTSRM